jgi:acyl dehydratase
MPFELENLGRWTEERTFVVTPEATVAYAAATNDNSAPHLDGTIAPPMFAVVPALVDVATEAMRSVWISDVEGYDTRSLHGEHDLTIYTPIIPGMTLRSRAAAVGLERKASGTLLVTRTETHDDRERLLNTMTFVNFLRDIYVETSVGEPARDLGPARVDASQLLTAIVYEVDQDQSFRYADASGDYGTYHIDPDAARSSGLPDVIVHGLCTMAFVARAIVEACCAGDSRQLRRLGVRFTRPLLPGQEMTIRIYRHGTATYAVEADDASGGGVIRRGIAEVNS